MDELEKHFYKSFIFDIEIVRDFFETVLLPLERDEVYYLLCQARKKYSDQIIKDPVIKRNILESNSFNRLVQLINEFSLVVPLKNDNEISLDRDMCVIYIDINPKSMFKAYKLFRRKIDDHLEQYYLYENKNIETYAKKLQSHLLSAISKSVGNNKIYSLFDLDTQDEQKFNQLIEYIKEKNLISVVKWISKTKNGYHFIIRANKKEKSILLEPIFRKKLSNSFYLPELEIKDKENTRTPICGTYQGGKPVEKVSLDVFN